MKPQPDSSSAAVEINRLHDEANGHVHASREALHAALCAAWRAGQLLLAEKKRVRRAMGPGAWLLWLEANFHGTPRTAQRYMKLARRVADVASLRGFSLRQAYARLGIATETKSGGALRHRLPAHVVLANKLVRVLKHQHRGPAAAEQGEAFRRDLRPLYDHLCAWFEASASELRRSVAF